MRSKNKPPFGTKEHLSWFSQVLKKYTDKSIETPEAARKTLMAEGILGEDGNLTENYR